MAKKSLVEMFLTQSTLAIVGVSRNDKKFGNVIFRELSAKGYKILPVNPNAERIGEERCYPSLKALPQPHDGLKLVDPPVQT